MQADLAELEARLWNAADELRANSGLRASEYGTPVLGVSRYSTAETNDGLTGDERQFLVCSFWPVIALALNGRIEEARSLFERLISPTNDLGLLVEEYDVGRKRQVGNFPQAFSHLTLILAARAISSAEMQAMQAAV